MGIKDSLDEEKILMVVRVDFTTYGGDVSKFYQEEFRYLGTAMSEFMVANEIKSAIEYLEIKFYFYREIDNEEGASR